ncbi:hypothetical protein HF324_09125 [Chitinophaga oryzae]|uniref:Uncharacterized protein n=1 Tax=Chitinophaga oryzae TaxID=2725414 RepID=A0AAE6ZG08_9BACT|nr:hypothetical protein [Chitinophaga oryzae]QJB31522.1 hypothetical protein HF329_09470 [Chitinophaga oryzae]QJB38004.1 hypothetical protein HF324_09125 [Chitinophaga oryzae]
MFNTLVPLMGSAIDSAAIITFLEQHGFKYPKKPFISNRATDTSYWIENKKLGIDLLFNAQPYLEIYPLIQGAKKGIFVPRLVTARWYNNKSSTIFPGQVDFHDSFERLNTALGAPTLKSSEISPVWLNDDGSESFYRWRIPVDKQRQISWGPEFTDEQLVKDIVLGLDYRNPLFHLYNEMTYGTFDQFAKEQSYYKTSYLIFLQWALDRKLIAGAGFTSALDWVQHLNRGYVTEEDFAAEHRFISAYINNLSGHDVLYNRDLAHTFLEEPALKDNYMGAAAKTVLDAIPFDRKHTDIVTPLLDRRLKEYQEHAFARSRP